MSYTAQRDHREQREEQGGTSRARKEQSKEERAESREQRAEAGADADTEPAARADVVLQHGVA